MSASIVSDTCRITVIAADRRADLAVPMNLPVAELLVKLVGKLGLDAADEGASQGGWVLQKFGDAPLDQGLTVGASLLRDGDILHLRTRLTHLPEIVYDDVLDAVAAGVLQRTPRWHAANTATACTALASATVALALGVALSAGPKWIGPAITAAGGCLLLLLAAISFARIYRKRVPALVCASFALAFGSAAAAMAVGGTHRVAQFGAVQLLPAACAAVLVAGIVLSTLGVGASGFVAVIGVGLLGAIGTGTGELTNLRVPAIAALVAGLALVVSPIMPMLAFRLSRIGLPAIPTGAADLRRATGTLDSSSVIRDAARADQYLTGFVAASAISVSISALAMVSHGLTENILAAVLTAICLLRARLFSGRGQRAVWLFAGGVAAVGLVVGRTVQTHGLGRVLAVGVPLTIVALVLFGLSQLLPGRRYSPPLSRAADVLETLLVLSVIPLALGVMGVYGKVRGLSN